MIPIEERLRRMHERRGENPDGTINTGLLGNLDRDSAYKVSNSTELTSWFGKSVVVDAQGKPLVVYHGTEVKDLTKFDTVKEENAEERGTFFSESRQAAAEYGSEVYPCYLRLVNPYEVTADQWANAEGLSPVEAAEAGFDGYIIRQLDGPGGDAFMAFEPSQIKQVTQGVKQVVAVYDESGWISPTGEFHEVPVQGHELFAIRILRNIPEYAERFASGELDEYTGDDVYKLMYDQGWARVTGRIAGKTVDVSFRLLSAEAASAVINLITFDFKSGAAINVGFGRGDYMDVRSEDKSAFRELVSRIRQVGGLEVQAAVTDRINKFWITPEGRVVDVPTGDEHITEAVRQGWVDEPDGLQFLREEDPDFDLSNIDWPEVYPDFVAGAWSELMSKGYIRGGRQSMNAYFMSYHPASYAARDQMVSLVRDFLDQDVAVEVTLDDQSWSISNKMKLGEFLRDTQMTAGSAKHNQFNVVGGLMNANESLVSLLNPEPIYGKYVDRVRSCLINIMQDQNRVSEKDFARMSALMTQADALCSDPMFIKVCLDFEANGNRPEMCAEAIVASGNSKHGLRIIAGKKFDEEDIREIIEEADARGVFAEDATDADKREMAIAFLDDTADEEITAASVSNELPAEGLAPRYKQSALARRVISGSPKDVFNPLADQDNVGVLATESAAFLHTAEGFVKDMGVIPQDELKALAVPKGTAAFKSEK